MVLRGPSVPLYTLLRCVSKIGARPRVPWLRSGGRDSRVLDLINRSCVEIFAVIIMAEIIIVIMIIIMIILMTVMIIMMIVIMRTIIIMI